PVDFTDGFSSRQTGLRFFDGFDRFKYHLELIIAKGACFKMLPDAVKHSVDRPAIEDPLSVLVQFIQTFRAGQLRLSRLLERSSPPTSEICSCLRSRQGFAESSSTIPARCPRGKRRPPGGLSTSSWRDRDTAYPADRGSHRCAIPRRRTPGRQSIHLRYAEQ